MIRKLSAVLLVSVLCCLVGEAAGEDPGYFLSWKQKRELLALGRIQDSSGTWYDVWICPGYVPPATYSRDSFKRAGANFHEYIEANKYRSLRSGSAACFDWALHECGMGFTLRGIPRAWGNHFEVAHERTSRRVFGWWLAYPWAFFESSVETAFRGALGAVGTVGGVASGLAVVPAYHALDSAVAGVWNLSVNTVIIPTVGVTWNTVVGPPLAMIGQKPAPSRVDGFWVTVVNAGRPPEVRQLTPAEVQTLSQWGLLLLKETKPYADKREQLERESREKQRQLSRQMEATRTDAARAGAEVTALERAHVRAVAATNGMAAALAAPGFAPAYGGECEQAIRRHLMLQNIPNPEIEKIIHLLRTFPSAVTMSPESVRKKTDPVQRGVEVLETSAEDTLKGL